MINLDIRNGNMHAASTLLNPMTVSNQNMTIARHSSLKPTPKGAALSIQAPSDLECASAKRRPSVTFNLTGRGATCGGVDVDTDDVQQKHFRSINSNLSIASQSFFNQRYNDYLRRVSEVNKAKDLLKTNRQTMGAEVKKRMIQHIKHKMTIVSLIEDELKMDSRRHKAASKSKSPPRNRLKSNVVDSCNATTSQPNNNQRIASFALTDSDLL